MNQPLLRRWRVIVSTLLVVGSVTVTKVATARGPDPGAKLAEVEQAQQALGERLTAIEERWQGIEARLDDVQTQLRTAQENRAIDRDVLEKIRNEMLGLYVVSPTRETVGKIGEQVDTLAGRLEKFRISVGILAGLVVVLQAFAIVMLFVRKS